MLTERQKRFCDEYLISLNAVSAYKKAGYTVKNNNVAAVEGCKLLKKPEIKEYIRESMESKREEVIASQDEVLEYFTSVMRGKSRTMVIVMEGTGKGYTKAKYMIKTPEERERLKAAELLAKRYDLLSGDMPDDTTDDGFIEALRGSLDVWEEDE